MNINNLIAVTPAFHFILQTNLEFPWLLYLWRLARNLGMHLKMIWIKYSIETYRSCQKMTKYHQIRDERTNLESHQFLMNSCFWKRIRRKIKVVQKMDLDKTLKRIRDKSSFPFLIFVVHSQMKHIYDQSVNNSWRASFSKELTLFCHLWTPPLLSVARWWRHQMRYYLASLYLCKTNGLHQLSEARNQIRGLRLKTNFSRSTLHLQDS